MSIWGTMYFVWIDGIAVGIWLLGRSANRDVSWQRALSSILATSAVALLLSAEGILTVWRASQLSGAEFYGLGEVNFWGASLNSLFLPFLQHPWLGSIALSLYRGLPFEQAQTNFGLIATLAALLAVPSACKKPKWRPLLLLAASGAILALGLTVKWDNEVVGWPVLRPLNSALWHVLHVLKPSFFATAQPPAPFDTAVPLPGMVLAGLVPYFERACVFARYALVASVGIFLLAALAVAQLRHLWLRLAIAGVLVFEVLPPPLPVQVFPPPVHPAFTWLQHQSMQGQTIADVRAESPYTLELNIDGETLWATRYHQQATVAGTSSVWPAHTRFLYGWLGGNPHPFGNPQFAQMLRYYRVRYLLLHVHGQDEQQLLQEVLRQSRDQTGQVLPCARDAGALAVSDLRTGGIAGAASGSEPAFRRWLVNY